MKGGGLIVTVPHETQVADLDFDGDMSKLNQWSEKTAKIQLRKFLENPILAGKCGAACS